MNLRKRGMNCIHWSILFTISLLFILPLFSYGAIYLGIVDGYVFNYTGTPVEGITVTAQLNACSGTGCTGTYVTDANGYYVIGNLNYQNNQGISVEAVEGRWQGSNTALTIDDSTPRQINITLCYGPYAPILTPQSDIHTFNSSLSWTSDTSFAENYDIYEFVGDTLLDAFSPQLETNLQFNTYTWRVRTCMLSCCSVWATDSFEVYNNPPPEPLLVTQPDTNANELNLSWSSVDVDVDGDTVYDQYQFDGGSIITLPEGDRFNLESDIPFGGPYTWRVRSCDEYNLCSLWVTDTFRVQNFPPSPPILVPIDDGHFGDVFFEWVSGFDPDGHSTYDEFRFVSKPVISPAVSGILENGLSFGDYYWKVRTCDEYHSCSSWVRDDFKIINAPPSEPVLNEIIDNELTNQTFEWISGVDSDDDDIYDVYQLSLNHDFSSITHSDVNSSSPLNIDNLSQNSMYFWRVRTCDEFNACSGWVSDSFYIANECVINNIQIVRKGGGNGKTTYTYVNQGSSCVPDIQCTGWSACLPNGKAYRNCIDKNGCFDIPELDNECYYNREVQYYIDDESKPSEESPTVLARTMINPWWIFTLVVFIIAVGEMLLALFYYEKYYKRERLLLMKLKGFIMKEFDRGIEEDQIANRLLTVGWTNREIIFALRWAKDSLEKKKRRETKIKLHKQNHKNRKKKSPSKSFVNPYKKE